ncbi:MAG: ABC transporter permease [Hyphomicrobiales bacterium]|nr:ABC transporter permease subunit [Hyphomicrobiales bacterium]PCJ91902.1 MAG: ABC transporter permease [Hyphomicrobiales bacterium]
MLKHVPAFTIIVLIGPVLAGLLGTALPAFGILPSLGGTQFTLEHFASVLNTPGIVQSSLISLYVGLITTFISLSVVMLVIAGWQGTRFFSALQGLLSPLLSVPHAAAAFGLAFLIAPSGWIARLLSPWLTGFARPPDWLIVNDTMGLSMMAGLIAKEIPFLLLMSLAALPQSDARRKAHVAASLGYGPITGFFKTTFPIVYRQIRLPVFAVLAYATSVVDVAIILGPTTPPPLSIRLLQWMNDPEIIMRFQASAGAQLQLAVTALALLFWLGFEKLGKRLGTPLLSSGARHYCDAAFRPAVAIIASTFALLVVAGILVLGIWSIAGFWRFPDPLPVAFTTATWMRQSESFGLPLQNSIVIGLISTAIAIALTLSCLEVEARSGKAISGRALVLLYLPLIVPQISFLFGLQVLFLQLGSNANMLAVVFTHVVFVLPYVYLSLADPWAAWDKRYAAVAHGLGHSDNSVFWRVRVPMMLTPILTAAAVGFGVSIGQYLATLLIGGGRFPTITTEAIALSSGGDRRVIGVYALVQTVLPFIGFGLALAIPAIVYRHRRGLREHA